MSTVQRDSVSVPWVSDVLSTESVVDEQFFWYERCLAAPTVEVGPDGQRTGSRATEGGGARGPSFRKAKTGRTSEIGGYVNFGRISPIFLSSGRNGQTAVCGDPEVGAQADVLACPRCGGPMRPYTGVSAPISS